MMKRIVMLGTLFALVAGAAFAAGSAMDRDTLIAGTESTYPPYESRDEKGELAGFDIELVNLIGEKLGKKIEWIDMPFDSLIPSLMTGKIDLVAAGLSATDERKKRVDFSAPYEISFSAFITKPGDDAPMGLEDLEGKTVAAQIGTVQETFARSIGNVEVKTYQKFDDCVREVVLGRVSATLMDIPVAKKYVQAKDFAGKVIIAFNQQITGADKAIATPKNDPALTDAVSKVIIELEQAGELSALRDKWFNQ